MSEIKSYILIAVLALFSIFMAFGWIREWIIKGHMENEHRAVLEGVQRDLDYQKQLGTNLEALLAQIRQDRDVLKGELENELAKEPVYRECRVPASGVQLLKNAIGNTTR